MKLIPSNDKEGDCSTAFTIKFDSAEQAEKFVEKCEIGLTIPINTGKHVYTAWDCILSKRGAAHPLMNPFNIKENEGVNYDKDCCKNSLELLKKAAHLSVNPD